MLAGLINICGQAVGAVRGATKAMLGQNPNGQFNLVNFVNQFCSPGVVAALQEVKVSQITEQAL